MVGNFGQLFFWISINSSLISAFREGYPLRGRRLLSHRSLLNDASLLPFEECWNADSYAVNPWNDTKIDKLLQRLCSPAPQSYFIAERYLKAQKIEDVEKEITFSEIEYLVKPGYKWAFNSELRQSVIIPAKGTSPDLLMQSTQRKQNVLEFSHRALRFAAEGNGGVESEDLRELVKMTKERLRVTLGTDVRGRSSADAAFSFALAGVDDKELYDMLATVTRKELQRVGKRPSFNSKYILQIIEKLAASGVRNTDVRDIHLIAADCLEFKGEHADIVEALRNEDESFDLLSPRALLWLWRFSSRQSKIKSVPVLENQQSSLPSWLEAFDDPTKPLVIDLGCGMGVSLLGLATIDENSDYVADMFLPSNDDSQKKFTRWGQANYLGCDLSQLATGYAQGIANRWNIQRRLQFVCGSGNDVLDEVKSCYPGEIVLALVQFPSPFKYKDKGSVGNSQLPVGLEDGFLASSKLFRNLSPCLRSSGGSLLLQSNVEDVAVAMQNAAKKSGFQSSPLPRYQSTTSLSKAGTRLPQRTEDWIQSGGERAIGKTWSSVPLLPARSATETEASCDFFSTPVHRCLLRVLT